MAPAMIPVLIDAAAQARFGESFSAWLLRIDMLVIHIVIDGQMRRLHCCNVPTREVSVTAVPNGNTLETEYEPKA